MGGGAGMQKFSRATQLTASLSAVLSFVALSRSNGAKKEASAKAGAMRFMNFAG
jgi:hypothetical protein